MRQTRIHLNALSQITSGKRRWPRRKQRKPNKANVNGVDSVLDSNMSFRIQFLFITVVRHRYCCTPSLTVGHDLFQGSYSDVLKNLQTFPS